MGTAIPCVAQQDIVAGRAVVLCAATGKSSPDVVIGAKYPTSDEDPEARYIANFRVYNEKTPIYETLPTQDESSNTTSQPYTLRGWVAGDSDSPISSLTMRLTHPRFQEAQTILSGALMLAYDEGIYTVESGCYTANSFVVGDKISVASGTGLWQKYSAAGKVAKVLEYDSTNQKLTIKIEN